MYANTYDSIEKYNVIIIGAGASGLMCAAAMDIAGETAGNFSLSGNGDAGSAFSGLILEGSARPGTKLLMSGGGHCNITHSGSIKDFTKHYHSAGTSIRKKETDSAGTSAESSGNGNGIPKSRVSVGKAIRTCLYKHSNIELRAFLEEHGVNTVEQDDGRVFPESMRAQDVLDVLMHEAAANGFEIRCGHKVTGIEKSDSSYIVTAIIATESRAEVVQSTTAEPSAEASTNNAVTRNSASTGKIDGTSGMRKFVADRIVIAAGGCSYPGTGSDGSMFDVIKHDLGVEVTELRPALCPIEVKDFSFTELAGISFKNVQVRIVNTKNKQLKNNTVSNNNAQAREIVISDSDVQATGSNTSVKAKGIDSSDGALLITHTGYSGPAALNISGALKPGDEIAVNFVYPLSYEQALQKLKDASAHSKVSLPNIIAEEFELPVRFARKIVDLAGMSLKNVAAALTGDVSHIKKSTGTLPGTKISDTSAASFPAQVISSTGSYANAMVTLGGVSLDEVDTKTMELKKLPGIYVIGEALDVAGDTGGYNLQFAYSSACTSTVAITFQILI